MQENQLGNNERSPQSYSPTLLIWHHSFLVHPYQLHNLFSCNCSEEGGYCLEAGTTKPIKISLDKKGKNYIIQNFVKS